MKKWLACFFALACVGPSLLVTDADARSRRGRSHAGVYAVQSGPAYAPRRFRARHVIVPMMLLGGGGGGSGPAMCYQLAPGWYCIPL